MVIFAVVRYLFLVLLLFYYTFTQKLKKVWLPLQLKILAGATVKALHSICGSLAIYKVVSDLDESPA